MTKEYIIREEAMSLPVLPKEHRIQLNNVDEAFEEGWRQALENLANLPSEKKLAAYKDAEEQGRLVILPCKIGDALFVTDEGTCLPAVRMVETVTLFNEKVLIQAVNSRNGASYYCTVKDFGKTVFLTREEANAAMGRGLGK